MNDLEARTVCIDLDFTLCKHEGDYSTARPLPGAVEALSRLQGDGWVIVLHTARHFNHWQVTTDWLADTGMPYDYVMFGKPPARVYVDDRAIRFSGDWTLVCEELRRIRTSDAVG